MGAGWIAISSILTAAIVAAGAYMTTWLNGRMLREGKAQDYERQDAVARQAAEAARLLAERQDAAAAKAAEAAELLLASNKRVELQTTHASKVVNNKLEQIHVLVNSTMTKQMSDHYVSLRQQLTLMHEVVTMNMAAGRKPSVEALEAIAAIERRITELGAQLDDRAKATEIADAQLTDKQREEDHGERESSRTVQEGTTLLGN